MNRCGTVLALVGFFHAPTQMVREELHSVTDAEDRQIEIKQKIGQRGRAGIVDTVGSAGQDDAARIAFGKCLARNIVRQDFGIDLQLANAPRDELRILRTEIEDRNRIGHTAPPSPCWGEGTVR